MAEVVPASVREFIRERLQALEQLEVLLLMRSESGRSFSVEELSTSLQTRPILIEAALAHLSHHRLVASEPGRPPRYRYAPAEQTIAPTVDALALGYDEARAEVLALISSDALGRVRRRVHQLRDRLKRGG